jgi:hypothetical protein
MPVGIVEAITIFLKFVLFVGGIIKANHEDKIRLKQIFYEMMAKAADYSMMPSMVKADAERQLEEILRKKEEMYKNK